MHNGFFRAILQRSASVWITQEAPLDRLYSGEQFVFTSVTHTEAKTTETNDHVVRRELCRPTTSTPDPTAQHVWKRKWKARPKSEPVVRTA